MAETFYQILQAEEGKLKSLKGEVIDSYSPVFSDYVVGKAEEQASRLAFIKEYGQQVSIANENLRKALDRLYEALEDDEGDEEDRYRMQVRIADAESGTDDHELEHMLNDLQGTPAGRGRVLTR